MLVLFLVVWPARDEVAVRGSPARRQGALREVEEEAWLPGLSVRFHLAGAEGMRREEKYYHLKGGLGSPSAVLPPTQCAWALSCS